MTLNFTRENTRLLADVLENKLRKAEESVGKMKALFTIIDSPELIKFADADFNESDRPDMVRQLDLDQKVCARYQSLINQCIELIPDFGLCFTSEKTIETLKQKFQKAPNWTEEEREKLHDIQKYWESNKEFINLGDIDKPYIDFDRYYKLWDEKNAGK